MLTTYGHLRFIGMEEKKGDFLRFTDFYKGVY